MAEEVARMRHDGSAGGRPARTASQPAFGGGEGLGAGSRAGATLRHSSGSAGPVFLGERGEEEGCGAASAGSSRVLSSRGRARRRDWHGWRVKPQEQGGLVTAASEPGPPSSWDPQQALMTVASEPAPMGSWDPLHVPHVQQRQQLPQGHQLQRHQRYMMQAAGSGGGGGGGSLLPAVAEAPMMISGAALAEQIEQMTAPPPPLSVANLVAWRWVPLLSQRACVLLCCPWLALSQADR